MKGSIGEYLKVNEVTPEEFKETLINHNKRVEIESKYLSDDIFKKAKNNLNNLKDYVIDNLHNIDEISFDNVRQKFPEINNSSEIYLKKIVADTRKEKNLPLSSEQANIYGKVIIDSNKSCNNFKKSHEEIGSFVERVNKYNEDLSLAIIDPENWQKKLKSKINQ